MEYEEAKSQDRGDAISISESIIKLRRVIEGIKDEEIASWEGPPQGHLTLSK